MNIISYTKNNYLHNAVRYIAELTESEVHTANAHNKSAQSSFDHVILFDDQHPTENLLLLSTYKKFRFGEKILILSDFIPAELVARFIREKCELVVQSSKSISLDWLKTFNFSDSFTSEHTTADLFYQPLLTYTEKLFLHAFAETNTNLELTRKLKIKLKTASSHRRSIMRKLGVFHLSMLLRYTNDKNFLCILSYL